MQRLPEQLLPELRAKWLRLSGAREVVQHAVAAAQQLDTDYQNTLNTCLAMLGLDPTGPWRVSLETGEIAEATEAEMQAHRNGAQVPA